MNKVADAALDAVCRHPLDVDDGTLPVQLAVDALGATVEVPLRIERSPRDVPAKITQLRVGRAVNRRCRAALAAVVRHWPGSRPAKWCCVPHRLPRPGPPGAMELQPAPANGLEPRLRRTSLSIVG